MVMAQSSPAGQGMQLSPGHHPIPQHPNAGHPGPSIVQQMHAGVYAPGGSQISQAGPTVGGIHSGAPGSVVEPALNLPTNLHSKRKSAVVSDGQDRGFKAPKRLGISLSSSVNPTKPRLASKSTLSRDMSKMDVKKRRKLYCLQVYQEREEKRDWKGIHRPERMMARENPIQSDASPATDFRYLTTKVAPTPTGRVAEERAPADPLLDENLFNDEPRRVNGNFNDFDKQPKAKAEEREKWNRLIMAAYGEQLKGSPESGFTSRAKAPGLSQLESFPPNLQKLKFTSRTVIRAAQQSLEQQRIAQQRHAKVVSQLVGEMSQTQPDKDKEVLRRVANFQLMLLEEQNKRRMSWACQKQEKNDERYMVKQRNLKMQRNGARAQWNGTGLIPDKIKAWN